MMKLSKILILLLLVPLANLFNVIPALALIPPLPSSFYGMVKVNGENVADGTMVKALINGQVYATGYTQTYQGSSVYALDIPGDDSSTTTIEGGRDNDVVQFMIGEALAAETGVWKSATNVSLSLTATAAAPLNTPLPTPTAVPTQTAIKVIKKTPTATPYVAPAPTERVTYPTLTSAPEPTRTHSVAQAQVQPTQSIGQSSNNPAQPAEETTTQAQPIDPQGSGLGNNILWIVLVLLAVGIVVSILRVYIRSSRSKER